ncbi:MAG: hypothetical protein IT303_14410 [Dehalococcoidia bacterium]|nr:hypothetical protein [Dehalococcoidia bacterium]
MDPQQTELVGGKAAGLARLARHGFAVPGAYVVSTAVTQAIEQSGWTDELRRMVAEAYESLAPGGEPVAVRSSAADEDGSVTSFAGQHLTVLDVHGVEDVCSAIEKVMASAWSEAALAYRSNAGHEGPAPMAVVIQRMVPAQLAGVAFGVDPITGDEERIVVEAVAGLGEALVSGEAEADRVVLSRDGLAVAEEHHAGATPVVTLSIAQEVARAVIAVEQAFGGCQDIEFAHDGTQLWLLQSRPVTARGGGDAGWVSEFDSETSEADLWTSANVQEILPGLVTPLTITVFNETVPRAYTMDYHDLRLLGRDEWPVFVGCFYNRVFLNMSATRLIGDRAFIASSEAIERRYLGGLASSLAVKPSWRTRGRNLRFKITSLGPLGRMTLTLKGQATKGERRVLSMEEKVRAIDPAAVDDARMLRIRDKMADEAVTIAKAHLRVTAMAGAAFEMVAGMVRPILGEETEARLPILFTGMQDVVSAQIGIDIWGLSRVALAEGIEGAVREESFDPYAETNPAWQRAWAEFIHRHGHRGLNEMEMAIRTWRYDPGPAIAVVRSFLDVDEEHSPPASLRRQEAERLALTEELAGQMNPARRGVFRYALREAQGWVTMRERTKSALVREARLNDHFMPEMQRRMVERGYIDTPDDIFFLASEELVSAFKGEGPSDYRDAVVRRRREYERNRHVLLPERFHGRPVPLSPEEAGHSGDVLTGTPVSAGAITGRARVIIDPRVDLGMQPGEILVAPVTDAGWTPLFALASGLVVDMGSALSHGSTVAREYGLPAVVNVRHGTRVIKTGDLIAVNGSKGTVTILEPAG